jgi:hypothetical protein
MISVFVELVALSGRPRRLSMFNYPLQDTLLLADRLLQLPIAGHLAFG